ncbi:MAG: DNA-processing protein DprA [Planctomycetes bacterium]|nr:DNA-processing protein DprA [Planctomycetota bacterium]
MDPYLMLALAEGFGESPVAALLEPDLDPQSWLQDPPPTTRLPPRVAARLSDPDLGAKAAAVRHHAAAAGLSLHTPDAPPYPDRLHHIAQRPLVLFTRGDPAILRREPAVALVGSRTPTPYGRHTAEELARALASAGVILWSGLARGIDAIAHRACIDASVPTVGVLAGGLDHIYPPEHSALADAIVAGGGCLLAELPPTRRPRRGHFVRRNRILAAGTPAVLVVEAGLHSGALHTARFAAECGTDVFAVPGPWQSERSQGCHRLIVEGANLVESPEALLRDLGVSGQGSAHQALQFERSADSRALLTALSHGPRPTDLLQRESGLERGAFLRAIMTLEESGAVRRLAGDLWAAATPRPDPVEPRPGEAQTR